MYNGRMVVETKLIPPLLKPGLLPRAQLLNRVRAHLHHRLIVVCAGPGYGKTTLLAQLIEAGHLSAAYYSLDPDDGDRMAFLEHLLASLSRVAPGKSPQGPLIQLHRLLDYIRGGRGIPNQLLIATVVNWLAARHDELFLVLDDYHHLSGGSPVHRLLAQLIERLPPNAHLMIASRSAPPLPCLAALRVKGEVFDVAQNELAVTQDDIRRSPHFAADLPGAESSLRRMLDATEGWIAGVQLALEAAGPAGDLGKALDRCSCTGRTLFDFFTAEIFGTLPAATRRLLVRCSVLAQLDPQACAAVAGDPDAGSMLADLARRNMFVSRAGEGYRCHSLFREFLRNRITDPGEYRRLCGAAADWFLGRGDVLSAVEHLIEASRPQQAARAMVPIVETVYNSARFELVARWLSWLPADLVERSPALLMGRAALHRYRNDHRAGLNDLAMALRIARRTGDRRYQARVLVQLGSLAYDDGRLTEAMRLARAAQRLGLRRGQRVKAGSDAIICLCHTQSGRYAAAERACRAIPQDLQQLYGAAIPIHDNFLCVVLTRSGRYAEALARYRRIVPGIEPQALFHPNACMFLMDAIIAARNHGSFTLSRQWFEKMRQAAALSDATALLERITSISLLVQDGRVTEAANVTNSLLAEPDLLSRWGYQSQTIYLKSKLVEIDYYLGNYPRSTRRLQQGQRPDEVDAKLEQFFRGALLASLTRRQADAVRCCRGIARLPANPHRDLLLSLSLAAASGRPAAVRHLRRAVRISGRYGMDGELALELRHHPAMKRLLPECGAPPARIGELQGLIGDWQPVATVAQLRISLLGSLAVSARGQAGLMMPWQGYKAASVLGFLLLHRGRHSTTEELTRQLWPGVDPARSSNRLFATISRLNAVLEGLIVHSAAGYAIDHWDRIVLDVDEFTEFHRTAVAPSAPPERRLDAARRCLALYHGPLLRSVGDLWVEPVRHAYHVKYLQALRAAIETEAAQGNWSASAEAARRLLADEPADEQGVVALLTGLGKMGLRSDMVSQFARYARSLRARGLSPSPGVLVAYQRLLG